MRNGEGGRDAAEPTARGPAIPIPGNGGEGEAEEDPVGTPGRRRCLRVGLTGGIASGKSVARRVFERAGIRMLDADALTHEFLGPGGVLVPEIVAAFGEEMRQGDGAIDRRRLGGRVFGDEAARERLNRIVHPRIRQEIASFLDRCEKEGLPAAGVEAALMIETGSAALYDLVVAVVCRPEQQRDRLAERSAMSPEEAAVRIGAQMSPVEKARRADLLVDASGTLAETEQAAALMARRLLDRAAADAGHRLRGRPNALPEA